MDALPLFTVDNPNLVETVTLKSVIDSKGNEYFEKDIIPKGTILKGYVLNLPCPYKAEKEVIEFEKSTDPIAMEFKKMRAELEESLGY
jgi:hypothetical protein